MNQEIIKVEFTKLEARAKVCGLPFREILRRSGFSEDQWYRWKRGEYDPFKRINTIIKQVELAEKEFNGDG